MRSPRRAFCLTALAAPVLACSRDRPNKTTSVPSAKVPLKVGFIGTGEPQPIGAEGWAHQNGSLAPFLEQQDFSQVSFVRFANGPDLNEAISGGSLDIGIYGDTPALVGRGAGLPTRLVNQSVVGMDAWLLAPAKGVSSLDELPGKTVATSKGSYMNRYLAGLLLEKGLTEKVTLIHLLPADAQAALDRGEVAAYAAPVQTAPLLVARGARVLDKASEHQGLSGSSVTVVTESFLQHRPEFPAAWNELRRRAVQDLKEHESDYYAYHSKIVRLPLELVKVGFPLSLFEPEPLVQHGLALLEGTQRFLFDQGLLRENFVVSDWAVPKLRPAP